MIDFYYSPTPNGWKVAILLEELGIDYKMHLVRIGKGDQFKPAFLAISPNNRIPAIVDHDGPEGPVSVFESGAIMIYLAEKTGRFLPAGRLGRKEMLEWMFWQVGGQGPMAGQLSHFVNYAPEDERAYGHKRYKGEYERLLSVMERRLTEQDWMVGDDYSIVDMICWPWVLIAKPLGASLEPFPALSNWRSRVKERPAVQRAVDLGKESRRNAPPTDEERRLLFEQNAASQAGGD
ncbi:MAG: glutathione S-transferase N-terminal domain-containing protein [Pseudomonadota bacterium]